MRKSLLLLVLLLLTTQAFALQIKGVVDNETVPAKISSLDVTRIFVKGDRIKSVKGVKGAYTRENDENKGEIYIQPTSLYQDKAFTILIETEQALHFTLLLNPVAVPSETLMLIPKGVGNQRAARFEQASDYELTISHLIRAMANDTLPDGYSQIQVNNKKIYAVGNIATLRLKTVYQGLRYRGEVYELTNTQNFPITLDEREFFKNGTRAVSLETINVLPNSKIEILRVVSHE